MKFSFSFDSGKKRKQEREAQATLDSTVTNGRNWSYYAGAHGGPAGVTFDRSTRQIAQNRCEMEYLNDVTLFGACVKSSALTVGVGATLKILGPYLPFGEVNQEGHESKCQFLESEWEYYAKQTRLWKMIRLIPRELIYHGECFVRRYPHPNIEEGFRYELIRPERVGNPYNFISDAFVFDGIRYDRNDYSGNPVAYYIRKEYVNPVKNSFEYEEVPAEDIIHVFSPLLPEQLRGIPPFQSGLPVIAQMRQLVKAELTAMINAARLSIIFKTNDETLLQSASDAGVLEGKRGGDTIEIPDGGMFAPPGYEPTAMDTKHPSAQFADVKSIMASDVGATIGLGRGKINNDHSSYNYSSAKMDEQIDDVVIEVTQEQIANEVLDVIFEDWFEAFAGFDAIAKEFLDKARIPDRIRRKWLWPTPKSLDPLKDAQAEDIRLKNGSTTLEEIYSKRRLDSKEQLAKWSEEKAEIAQSLEATGLGYSTSGAITTETEEEHNGNETQICSPSD